MLIIFNKKIKVSVIILVLISLTGCNNSGTTTITNTKDNINAQSSSNFSSSQIFYNKMDKLYEEVNKGVAPHSEELILKLESIINGYGKFYLQKDSNSYEIKSYVVPPKIQQQIDDAGVVYANSSDWSLAIEDMSEIKINVAKNIVVNDLNTNEKYKSLVDTIINSRPGATGIGTIDVVTGIQHINKVDFDLSRLPKTYNTVEELDQAIRNREVNKGSNFFLGHYTIINQNTILAVERGNSNNKREFSVTPYIVEQLKNAKDENFIIWHDNYLGKDYIVELEKIN